MRCHVSGTRGLGRPVEISQQINLPLLPSGTSRMTRLVVAVRTEVNHFAKCCRSSRKGGAVGQIQQPNESAQFVLSVNSVTSAYKPFKTCSLQLADTIVTLIIAIGAKVSILNDSLYRKHFSAYPLHPPEGILSTYDSSEIPLEGMVHLPVTYQSETIQNFPFYVTEVVRV